MVATLLAFAGASCGTDDTPRSEEATTALRIAPAARAVHIETAGCGLAPDRTGSGIAVGDGVILTVAHLVARADEIAVAVDGGPAVDAAAIAVDLDRDLALLRFSPNGMPPIETSSADRGDSGLIVGSTASGTVPFEVADVVRISIEEVLGTDRHKRLGYELAAITTTGDSGAGAYSDENRLVGMVFATSDEGAVTWITSSAEIVDFLAEHESATSAIRCNQDKSRLDL